ncbi:MAG TPA: signal peptidase I [Ilumatobacteraceae bacterium]|jgi:signal peptidase I|nr:signal peptidase I [Microthrixaceae bacterium]HQZ37143.1 signal peptidase I [Ilumatobacteraceae bacterium]HRB05197.1 signal peptidase I [Ilumatobacteraceae bacterium]
MQHLALWLTRVQSESMTPCLRDGQLVWTIRCRSDRSLRRGAVVAVDSRELGFRIVKRIVGLPGEHLRFEGSELWVDGRPVAEPYAIHSSFRGTFDVPEGHYLLLGDNRVASNDARAWRRPYVARTEIVGVLLQRNRDRSPDRRGDPAPLVKHLRQFHIWMW